MSKYCTTEHSYTKKREKKSLFSWNSDLTGCSIFYLATLDPTISSQEIEEMQSANLEYRKLSRTHILQQIICKETTVYLLIGRKKQFVLWQVNCKDEKGGNL